MTHVAIKSTNAKMKKIRVENAIKVTRNLSQAQLTLDASVARQKKQLKQKKRQKSQDLTTTVVKADVDEHVHRLKTA